MRTNFDDDDYEIKISKTSEMAAAYEAQERFHREWGGKEEKPDLDAIRSFVYRIYPTFFLQGIGYRGNFFVIQGMKVQVDKSLVKHCPSPFSRMILSEFIRKLMVVNEWKLAPEEIASIIVTCSSDFSEAYMEFFPYTVRVFTGNELKRAAYRTAFECKPINFCVYEFIEPQADVDEVVRSKLTDVESTDPDPEEISMVDDTGLSLVALGGNPGSMVKEFLERLPPERVTNLLTELKENRGHLEISLGATYVRSGIRDRILVKAYFPFSWRREEGVISSGFDPFIRFESDGNPYMEQSPQSILMGWLWHRFKRRMSGLV